MPSESAPWHPLCASADLALGCARAFTVAGERIAVIRHAGGLHAIAERCPHERVSLVAGRVCNGSVTCPGHQWAFRLADGQCVVGPGSLRARTYPVAEIDGRVAVQVVGSTADQA